MGRAMVCGDAMHGTGETQRCSQLMFTHLGPQVRNPRLGNLEVRIRISEYGSKEMGPGAGIEPTSEEPQSPMLPLHHPGHGLSPPRERNPAEWTHLISLFMESSAILHKPRFPHSFRVAICQQLLYQYELLPLNPWETWLCSSQNLPIIILVS